MFNAPQIIGGINDIAQIYDINDAQCQELDAAVERMDANISLDDMDEDTIIRWEKILEITPLDNESLRSRRFRIKTKVTEKLPYSYRVLKRMLDHLCGEGNYILALRKYSLECQIYDNAIWKSVEKLFESVLPLNIDYAIYLGYTHPADYRIAAVLQDDKIIDFRQI